MKVGLAQGVAYAAIAAGMVYASGRYPSTPPTWGDIIMGAVVLGTVLLLLSRNERHSGGSATSRKQANHGIAYRAGKMVQRFRRNLT